ncbi:helix-turn-helix domain-containing protein [uncultured Flavonifractor sp.]|uniref:helix-turn-helix domain-containing protein n=1 Tax=uncultured Flavonifractor sp. TaxID=1193534 RepID=UPI002593A5D4|nr:helix-turn-helix domain-containing protein [uncultured Flavonifractor sp.]
MDGSVLKFPDLLRVEGVMAKGFGIICKFPMLDPDLNLAAKAIYALLCAYAGSGDTAFPSREKMMGLLQVGKDKYYSGLKQLTAQGYVTVEQRQGAKGRFDSNIYTIVSNPKKFAAAQHQSDGGELTFGFTGLKSDGYGMIPRMVMFDQRLTCTAKVIYAYLASYSGAGKVAFPKVKDILYHLGLSKTTFGSHMDKLIALNYITREQRRVNGKLATNNYRLNDCPDEAAAKSSKKKAPRPKNKDTAQGPKNPDTVQPDSVAPDTVYPYTAGPDTENRDTTNTSSFINSSPNISPSINTIPHWTDGMSREEIMDEIRDDLELALYSDDVRRQHGITLSDDTITYFIGLIADFVYSRQASFTAQGRRYTREEAVSRLFGLSLEDYQMVFDRVARVEAPIRNRRKYILASLITAREDGELQLQLEAARNLDRPG